MVNNIKDNTISKISAKKDLNTLNEIKNAGMIIQKKHTPKQKEFIQQLIWYNFNWQNNKIKKSKRQHINVIKRSNCKWNGHVNDKTLMSWKDDDDENENRNENENEDDDETTDQNKKRKIIKGTNDLLDEITGKSKSFEEQIKSLKKPRRSKRVLAL